MFTPISKIVLILRILYCFRSNCNCFSGRHAIVTNNFLWCIHYWRWHETDGTGNFTLYPERPDTPLSRKIRAPPCRGGGGRGARPKEEFSSGPSHFACEKLKCSHIPPVGCKNCSPWLDPWGFPTKLSNYIETCTQPIPIWYKLHPHINVYFKNVVHNDFGTFHDCCQGQFLKHCIKVSSWITWGDIEFSSWIQCGVGVVLASIGGAIPCMKMNKWL